MKYSIIGAIIETRCRREGEKLPPKAMNTMLTKQSREEAVAKKKARTCIPVLPVTPTNLGKKLRKIFKKLSLQFLIQVLEILGQVLTATVPTAQVGAARPKPKCSLCKQPMKQHKNVANCP